MYAKNAAQTQIGFQKMSVLEISKKSQIVILLRQHKLKSMSHAGLSKKKVWNEYEAPLEKYQYRQQLEQTDSIIGPHPECTTQARRCLTLEIRRDPVVSPWYGRRHEWNLDEPIKLFIFK